MNILLLIPILVCITGVYLLFKIKFFFLNPKRFSKEVGGLLGKEGAVGNLSLALAGTLGVGNVIGVSAGILVGGAGSVFWLIVSAIPAAAIKYAESSLARDSQGAGVITSSRAAFPRLGKILSPIYALFAVLLAFFMGAGLQSASLTSVISSLLPVSRITLGIALAVVTLPFIFFGAKIAKGAAALFVFAASAIYIFISLYLIILNRENLPSAVHAIFKGAFTGRGVLGGFLGTFTSLAFREGFLRGILSNEAGLGTSAFAHDESAGYTPHGAGVVGILEVYADTLVLCPLTALVLLTATDSDNLGAVDFVLSAISKGGAVFEYLFAVSLFFFAFCTVICWGCYGKVICGTSHPAFLKIFTVTFPVSVIFGALFGAEFFIVATDLVMLPLAVISLLTVIKSSDRVKTLSESDKLK